MQRASSCVPAVWMPLGYSQCECHLAKPAPVALFADPVEAPIMQAHLAQAHCESGTSLAHGALDGTSLNPTKQHLTAVVGASLNPRKRMPLHWYHREGMSSERAWHR